MISLSLCALLLGCTPTDLQTSCSLQGNVATSSVALQVAPPATSSSAPSQADPAADYSRREAVSSDLEEFTGGTVVIIGVSAAVVILLVILLIFVVKW